MELRIGVVADLVSTTSEGKVNLLGIFDSIAAAQVPAIHPLFYLFASFTAGVVEGTEHQLQITLVDEDSREVIPPTVSLPLPFAISGAGKPLIGQVIAQFPNVQFPDFGDYEFRLYIDGEYKASIPLSVDRAGMAE